MKRFRFQSQTWAAGNPPKPRSIQTALVVWHHDCVLNELQPGCKAALDQKSPLKYQLIIKTWRSFKTQGHCGSSLINTPLIYSQMLQERQEFLPTIVTFLLMFSSRCSCPRMKYGCWNSVSSFSGFTSPPCSIWTTFRKPSMRNILTCYKHRYCI